jgi:putative transposase
VIGQAVWLYFRFPLSLRMVEEMLAARGIVVSHETIRQWALKFGQEFANRIRQRLPRAGDKWHFDEILIKVGGVKGYQALQAWAQSLGVTAPLALRAPAPMALACPASCASTVIAYSRSTAPTVSCGARRARTICSTRRALPEAY